MSQPDWRSPGAYDNLRSLDAPGFAWEYLRRNADFLKQRDELDQAARRGALDPAEVEAFTRRWGVRFRGDGRDRQHNPRPLGRACAAHYDNPHSPAD